MSAHPSHLKPPHMHTDTKQLQRIILADGLMQPQAKLPAFMTVQNAEGVQSQLFWQCICLQPVRLI